MNARTVWAAAALGALTGMALAGVAAWWLWPTIRREGVKQLISEARAQSPVLAAAL